MYLCALFNVVEITKYPITNLSIKMKHFFSTVMFALAVMAANAAVPALNEFPAFTMEGNGVSRVPAAKQASPVELKEYKQSTFECAYFDWWYFGYSENSHFGYVIFTTDGKEVAFTVMSKEETDMCAYYDNVQFPMEQYEDRDDEAHYYMSTYWILNSPNGVRLGGADSDQEVVAQCVKEVSSSSSSMLALRTGEYYLYVYEINYSYDDYGTVTGVSKGGYARVKFSLRGDDVQGLKAEVAADKKSASISWTDPLLPADAHLYVNIQTGAESVYDNYGSKKSPSNPLVIEVQEGRTYKVTAQYVTSRSVPLGSDQVLYFTVGTDNHKPSGLQASVTEDQVELSWTATEPSAYYGVNIYQNGFQYATYTVEEAKLTKRLPTGTYTWEVAAFEKSENGLVYQLTEYVQGEKFSTESAPLPDGTIEMNVWAMEAFYMEEYAAGGKYPWLITLETGTSGGTGLPEVWIIVWSNREFGLSGTYSSAAGNIEISATAGEGSLINTNGSQTGLITANSVQIELQFDGFDQDYAQLGYYIPYYSGSFLMTCADGNTYHGTMNQLICGTWNYNELTISASGRSTIYSMFDEAAMGVEDAEVSTKATKRIENGQLVIERNGVRYSVTGNIIQ